jgi:hypothetical protein
MNALFKDIKGELSQDHLEILLATRDFNNPDLSVILGDLKLGHRAQFSEFQKSARAKKIRTSREKLPLVDFQQLPAILDDTTLNNVQAYYKADLLWKAVRSMLTASQLTQVTEEGLGA